MISTLQIILWAFSPFHFLDGGKKMRPREWFAQGPRLTGSGVIGVAAESRGFPWHHAASLWPLREREPRQPCSPLGPLLPCWGAPTGGGERASWWDTLGFLSAVSLRVQVSDWRVDSVHTACRFEETAQAVAGSTEPHHKHSGLDAGFPCSVIILHS